ncbi:SAM-dependent methyltransferase, partial [Nocardiopsis tropica]|nr:SAM-dependent methyltransferase [Nocardiopsis tropica]
MTDNSSPSTPDSSGRPPQIDTTRTHSARIWNYWMGGKDNYPVDREAGDAVAEFFPEIRDLARTSRDFLIRVVTHLAGEAGIRQFLDIGTGMPTANNTHEVAQAVAPESRVVYVDNDPLVLAHARALLVGTPEGATEYLDADVRDPERILELAAQPL